jgi:hypothetical protein
MKQFVISLGNRDVVFDLLDTDIAQRWANEIQNNYPLYETDRFKGWPTSSKDYFAELKQQIDIVNQYSPITNVTEFTQETLNVLHRHFEDLRGRINEATDFYNNAPTYVQSAIDKFNILIHELEHQLRHSTYPEIVGTYRNRPRINLLDEDFNHFTFKWNFGYVYINYCEVGKPILDVFKDQDMFVDNVRPLEHYSADFMIKFGPDTLDDIYNARSKQLSEWISKQNYNFKNLSLGLIPVAKLNYTDSNFLDLTQQQIIAILTNHQQITSTCIR